MARKRVEMNQETTERLKKAIIEMDSGAASAMALEIISKGQDVNDAVVNGLNAGMRAVADSYDRRENYLPQVLASANAFYAAFDILRPHLTLDTQHQGRKLIIGVVEGDIHDIGKNLIKVMIEGHGYECIDLGRDVPTDDFLEKIKETDPDYIAISTLMTPTLRGMHDLVQRMTEDKIREGRKVMVGGGQVTKEFADEIGADFYGVDDRDTVAWLRKQELKEVDK
jgi:methanogenic corrinoid protein MtbC1